jgi:hypothetical protein
MASILRKTSLELLRSVSLISPIVLAACAKKEEPTPAKIEILHENKKLISYSFGQMDFAVKKSIQLTLRNSGESSAQIESLAVKDAQGTSISSFNYEGGAFPGTSGSCQTSIAEGSECTIVVEYTAPTGQPYVSAQQAGTATLTYNNSKGLDTATVDFSATYRRCAAGSEKTIEQANISAGSAATIDNADFIVAQSMKFSATTYIKKITLSQAKWSGVTLSHVKLYVFNGGAPVGSLIKSEQFPDPGLVASSRQFFTYTFTDPVAVTANNSYVVGVSYVAPSGYVTTDKYTNDTYPDGNYLYSNNGGSTWTPVSGHDVTFSIETCKADSVEEAAPTYQQ